MDRTVDQHAPWCRALHGEQRCGCGVWRAMRASVPMDFWVARFFALFRRYEHLNFQPVGFHAHEIAVRDEVQFCWEQQDGDFKVLLYVNFIEPCVELSWAAGTRVEITGACASLNLMAEVGRLGVDLSNYLDQNPRPKTKRETTG